MCSGDTACSQNPTAYWNKLTPTPADSGCTGTWQSGEPTNFEAVSTPLFRGKFSTSGQLLDGYTIDPSSPYPSDLATTTIRQTVNGSGGSNVTVPTNADVAQFPISRTASFYGQYCA